MLRVCVCSSPLTGSLTSFTSVVLLFSVDRLSRATGSLASINVLISSIARFEAPLPLNISVWIWRLSVIRVAMPMNSLRRVQRSTSTTQPRYSNVTIRLLLWRHRSTIDRQQQIFFLFPRLPPSLPLVPQRMPPRLPPSLPLVPRLPLSLPLVPRLPPRVPPRVLWIEFLLFDI